MRRFLIVLVAVALSGCAETTEPPIDPPTALETGTLRGTVVDAAIRPVEAAEIIISFNGTEAAILTTDAEGAFGVGDLDAGTYQVQVAKPGFHPVNATADVVAGVITPEPVEIRLEAIVQQTSMIVPLSVQGLVACAPAIDGGDGSIVVNLCGGVNGITGVDIMSDEGSGWWHDELAIGEPAQRIIAELVWEPNQQLASDGQLTIWTFYGDELAVSDGSDSWDAFGQEYIRLDIAGDDLATWDVGGANGIRYGVMPGTGDGVGVWIQQPFDLFVHVFYGCEPIEGWSFVAGDAVACT